MVGFDDAAMMGLGALNAGVQMFGATQQARYNRQLQALQRAQAERHYEDDIKNVGLNREDTTRQNYFGQQQSRDAWADQQGVGGSMQNVSRDRMQGAADRQIAALNRQETMLTADWIDQKKMWELQDKMAKSAQTMSMISGLLMQGGSGAAGAMGGM